MKSFGRRERRGMIGRRCALLLVALVILGVTAASSLTASNEQTVGLFLNDEGAFDGYTLFAPLNYDTSYLIDNDGRLIQSWTMASAGVTPYLLEDGSIIRSVPFGAERVTWDGARVWTYVYSGGLAHHDIEVLPNGNVLMIVWETKSAAEAIAAGRDPDQLPEGKLWPEFIIEVEPTGPTSGNVVWEWHSWDHLVQDYDAMQNNYAVVGDHPELIDINFIDSRVAQSGADWHHANAIDYNEELDQIVLSVRHFSEIWVIDHSTTTQEAEDHEGGTRGKGGDILYRWGNPQAYRAGDRDDQQLFLQHDSRWIEQGLPGEGNILVFNNGNQRLGLDFSSVDEIVPPLDLDGNYALAPGEAYGPAAPTWTYTAANPSGFFASFISGATRLLNGNTLIDDGPAGTLFEVTADGKTVWRYVNPVTDSGPLVQGDPVPIGSNFVFRAYRYAPDYPGLQGRDLTPGEPIEFPKGFLQPTPTPVTCLTEPPATPSKQPHPCDTDGDGCSDAAESGLDENAGGRRVYTYFWDFFDVWTRPPGDPDGWHRDRAVTLSDIFATVLRFGRGPALGEEEALAAALTPPSDATSYHAAYDRGPIIGANDWDRAPADGVINIPDDILGIGYQFGHDCT